jgi:hypothetical protein
VDDPDYCNHRRIKAKRKGLPPALHRQQALFSILVRPKGFGRTTPFSPTAVFPKSKFKKAAPCPTQHQGVLTLRAPVGKDKKIGTRRKPCSYLARPKGFEPLTS